MMRLGYDLRPFLREETGVGVYVRNLLSHLSRIDTANEYFLFSASWKDRFPAAKLPRFERMQFRDLRFPVRALNSLWYRWKRPSLDFFFGTALDVTHSPTPLVLPTKGRKVVTVCDLFFMENPGKADREARRFFFKKAAKSLEEADGVVAISEFTRKAVLERFRIDPDKVRTIRLGLDGFQRKEAEPGELVEIRARLRLPSKFLLFVGAAEPRKNLGTLLEALSIVHQRFGKIMLVIAGREGGDSLNLRRRIAGSGLESWVKMTGYLSERDVRHLYRLASVFVYPSLCEGFGLPLIEAMAGRLPVASSSAAALPEIGGDAAVYFRPDDPEDMADKIVFLLSDESARLALVEAGERRSREFDWEKTAADTLAFYRFVLGRG